MSDGDASGPWWKKLGWLVLIWGCSVAVLGIVSYLIRLWIT